ncbi:MAG: hypothetical protein ABF318_11705, partial [Ketobacter sp.]
IPKQHAARVRRLQAHGERPAEKPWKTIREALSDLPDPKKSGASRVQNHVYPEAGTEVNAATNPNHSKCLVIQGRLKVRFHDQDCYYTTGDWFEIPSHTEYEISYESDCSIIEFWFDAPRTA